MIQYTNSSQFKFSAKSPIITVPSTVKSFSQQDQEAILSYCQKARDIYVQKVTEHTLHTIGKKLCALSIRQEAFKLSLQDLLPKYPQLPSLLQQIKSQPRKVHPRTTTSLDFIES